MCGEAAKVNEPSVNDWLRTFQPIRERYSLQNTFNMDESGIFFNLLPERSLDLKGNKCHGGARSKERLTAVFCCNADGSEKHKVWIIGKSKNPRCLKNVNRLYLPCEYSHHRAAWIESTSFREWLLRFNRKMITQKRHVLLTMDNCAAHKITDLELSNVTVQFFPSNTTSCLQPLDQGIIANVKRHYRVRLLRAVIRALELNQEKPKWNILQAMRCIANAWNSVTAETIQKCFNKAWTRSDEVHSDDQVEQPEEWLDYQNVVAQLPGYSFEEFINLDNDLSVCAEPKVVSAENQVDEGDEVVPMVSDNESEGSESEEIRKPSKTEIGSALSILERFSATTEVSEHFVECLNHIGEECAAKMRPIMKQLSITQYFKKK